MPHATSVNDGYRVVCHPRICPDCGSADVAAAEGASLRESVERMGHSRTRAALIYLHGSDERQRALADAVSERARTAIPSGRRRRRPAW